MEFHRTYERLAPFYGYETREETRHFDPASTNGQLMLKTCEELLKHFAPSAMGDTTALRLARNDAFEMAPDGRWSVSSVFIKAVDAILARATLEIRSAQNEH